MIRHALTPLGNFLEPSAVAGALRAGLELIRRRKSPFALALLVALSFSCSRRAEPIEKSPPSNAELEGEYLIEQYRSLDRSRDSTMKLRASIEEADGSTKQVQMILYRKREPDGSQKMLAEFISPAEERDRSALVIVHPDGRLEGIRYVQSSDSFIVARSPTDEESLFGMTLQEFAGGQTEKYAFRRAGESQIDSTPVHILDGKLKRGAESKFERLRLFISKENWAALLIEAYDDRARLLRRVATKELKLIGGYLTRTRWEVDNLERQKKIRFEALDVKYDQGLSDSIFTRERLKRAASK